MALVFPATYFSLQEYFINVMHINDEIGITIIILPLVLVIIMFVNSSISNKIEHLISESNSIIMPILVLVFLSFIHEHGYFVLSITGLFLWNIIISFLIIKTLMNAFYNRSIITFIMFLFGIVIMMNDMFNFKLYMTANYIACIIMMIVDCECKKI
jgi:hypothetical protein